jgi:hypothetical protein
LVIRKIKWKTTEWHRNNLSPFHKEDDTLHKTHFFYVEPMKLKTGSSVHGKFLYNNDCHKKEGSHTDFHRKIGFCLSRPSEMRSNQNRSATQHRERKKRRKFIEPLDNWNKPFSLLQCAGQDMASKQVQGKEGMGFLVYFHSDDLVSFSLASMWNLD